MLAFIQTVDFVQLPWTRIDWGKARCFRWLGSCWTDSRILRNESFEKELWSLCSIRQFKFAARVGKDRSRSETSISKFSIRATSCSGSSVLALSLSLALYLRSFGNSREIETDGEFCPRRTVSFPTQPCSCQCPPLYLESWPLRYCLLYPSMEEDCVGWDGFISVFVKDEVAVGFALQETHREAWWVGWTSFRTNATRVAR